MKKSGCLFLIIFTFLLPTVFAQEDNQILIFRHNGEVNLLYANEVDSIVFSAYDKDSIFHEDYVSQVFYAKDTTLLVPIQDIDSVAFGNRNITVFQPHAHALASNELTYIVHYDGNNIYYLSHTPANLLPAPGDKLFLGEITDVFPDALCVKVNSITFNGTHHVANVSSITLNEMFSQLFYAGTVSTTPVNPKRSSHAITHTIHLGEQCDINLKGELQLNTCFVVSPLTSYYYAKVGIQADLGFETQLSFTDIAPYHYESGELLRIPFSPILGILYPSFSLQAFADINAELAFEYSMKRSNAFQWEWKRVNGENSFNIIGGDETATPTDNALMNITCNGELFFGLQPVFQFNLPFETAGARAKTKIGPSFSSELSIGVLRSLQEYQPEEYHKGELSTALKFGLEGTVFYRNLMTGEENETSIFHNTNRFFERKIQLFPQFEAQRAVQLYAPEEALLSVSSKTKTPIINELEMGFEIITFSGATVDSVFLEAPIQAGQTVTQGFSTEIPLNKTYKEEELLMRPIFHYARYTVRAQQSRVSNNSYIQPVTAYATNGLHTFISSYPYIGHAKVDSTLYNIGGYLPVHVIDTVFSHPQPFITGIYLSPDLQEQLIGTWEGEINGSKVQYTFSDKENGNYVPNAETTEAFAFQYSVNTPQTGDIQLIFKDSGQGVMVITTTLLNRNQMKIKFKKENTSYLFTKIN